MESWKGGSRLRLPPEKGLDSPPRDGRLGRLTPSANMSSAASPSSPSSPAQPPSSSKDLVLSAIRLGNLESASAEDDAPYELILAAEDAAGDDEAPLATVPLHEAERGGGSFAASASLKAEFGPGLRLEIRKDGAAIFATSLDALGIRSSSLAGVLADAEMPAPGTEEGSGGAMLNCDWRLQRGLPAIRKFRTRALALQVWLPCSCRDCMPAECMHARSLRAARVRACVHVLWGRSCTLAACLRSRAHVLPTRSWLSTRLPTIASLLRSALTRGGRSCTRISAWRLRSGVRHGGRRTPRTTC